jgi:hypothetical protein
MQMKHAEKLEKLDKTREKVMKSLKKQVAHEKHNIA